MRNISLSILLALTSSLMAADFTPTPLPPLFVDREEPIVFPEDAGVINVKQPPYNSKGDGVALNAGNAACR